MATDWQAQLTLEERETLLQLDLAEMAKIVDGITASLITSTDTDYVQKVGAVALGLLTFIPVKSHSLLAAIAMEKLAAQRQTKNGSEQ